MVGSNVTTLKVTKIVARNFLADVSEEKVFWSHDGQTFKNLRELAQGLDNMTYQNFMFHVNENRNDFAKWVREVVGDQDLASDLEKTGTHLDASRKVTNRVNYLNSIK